jgi:hypothetical protein
LISRGLGLFRADLRWLALTLLVTTNDTTAIAHSFRFNTVPPPAKRSLWTKTLPRNKVQFLISPGVTAAQRYRRVLQTKPAPPK